MEQGFQFERTDGTEFQLRLPDRDDPGAGELVDMAADAAFEELKHRANSARRAPASVPARKRRTQSDPLDWFRPVAYQLISACLEFGLEKHLLQRNTEEDRYLSSNFGPSSDFGSGVMAIVAKFPRVISDRERSKMGLGLLYAYRHYVPPCLVNGFVRQVGELNVTRAGTAIEPYFDGWIVERRVLDFVPTQARGTYPRRIEDRIKRLRADNARYLGTFFEAQAAEHDELG